MLEHRLEKRKITHDKGNQRDMERIRESFLIYRKESNSVKSNTGDKGNKEIQEEIYMVNYENLFLKSTKQIITGYQKMTKRN